MGSLHFQLATDSEDKKEKSLLNEFGKDSIGQIKQLVLGLMLNKTAHFAKR